MAKIGDVLIRKKGDGPKKLEIIAAHAGDWITRDAEDFGPTEARSPNNLRTNYGGDGEPAAQVVEYLLLTDPAEREAAQKRLTESMREANRVEDQRVDDARTPEETFAAAKAASDAEFSE
jgi:hypothetical protein